MNINIDELSEKLRVHPGVKEISWFDVCGIQISVLQGSIRVEVKYSVPVPEIVNFRIEATLNNALVQVIDSLNSCITTTLEQDWVDCFYLDGICWGFLGTSAVIPLPVPTAKKWKRATPFFYVDQDICSNENDNVMLFKATLRALITQY